MSAKSSQPATGSSSSPIDPVKLIGIALVALGIGLFLWKRSSSPGGGAEGISATVSEAELVNIRWRKRAEVERPGLGSVPGKVVSAVETEVAAAVTDTEVARQLSLVEANGQNWETEAFNEVALARLKQLGKIIAAGDAGSPGELAGLIGEEFTSSPLLPGSLERVGGGGDVVIERAGGAELARVKPELIRAEGFGAELRGMLGSGEPRLSFKIVRIGGEPGAFSTRVLVEVFVREEQVARQINAIWEVRWRGETMIELRLASFERVTRATAAPMFAEVTAGAFAGVASYPDQFLRDNVHWAERLSVIEGTSLIGHTGVVVGDINGDGLDDLYVPDGGGLPNRMYLQQADGTLRDYSEESGTDWLEYTPSALLVDLDNDGDQDLIASTVQMLLLMENDGGGKFTLVGARAGAAQARTMCAADYDLDGDLDVFICNYAIPNTARGFGAPGMVSSFPLPYNDANNGAPNLLLENRGGFRFADVTAEVGLGENNARYSLSAAWDDFDQDGDADLYVANDFGRNNLYRNDGGRFHDVAAEMGVEDVASGMSVAFGDYDRDGRNDLYISNMFSSAGGRVAFQRQFAGGRSAGDVAYFQRMARGNTLFRSGDGGGFTDVSEAAGVTMGRWAWSSQFADLNNDGWLDLVVANGFVTGSQTRDL